MEAALFSGALAALLALNGQPVSSSAEADQLIPGHRVIELQANTFTTSTQENAALDIDADGNILMVWDSRRQHRGYYGVVARLFDAHGRPLTDEFRVSQVRNGMSYPEREPAVAFAPDGTAWITWSALGRDGQAGTIVARRFAADLRPLTDEIVVNARATGHQHAPTLAVDKQGGAMIVWTDAAGDCSALAGRALGPDGGFRTEAFVIDQRDAVRDELPQIERLPSGSYALAWARVDLATDSGSIRTVRLDNDGAVVGSSRSVTAAEEMLPVEPSMAVDDDGRLIITWMRPTAGGHDVIVGRFTAEGEAIDGPRRVARAADGWLSGATAVAIDEGRFAILYNRADADGDGTSVFGALFSAEGAPVRETVRITRAAAGTQHLQAARNARRCAWGAHGQLVVAWAGDSGHGDTSAVNLTLMMPEGLDLPHRAPLQIAFAEPVTLGVEAPIPPVFDPTWVPEPRLENAGGDGPDFGFEGVTATGWTPPDPEVAAGPNDIVMMTNGAIAFFDRTSGALLFQDEIENSFGFWGALGADNFVFDPEVLYDPHSGRFFAMACERSDDNRSKFLIAVSDDSDPMGTWFKYRWDVTHIDNDIDSPNMAVDENVLYLSADFFGPDKYPVFMIDKAPLLIGGAITSTEVLFQGAGNQSMGLPIMYDVGASGFYIIQSSEGTGNGITFSEVRFHAITDQLGNPQVTSVDVGVPTYSYPNRPPQRGSSSRPFLFEPRFWSCTYIGGSLWAVHHVNETRARARWYEFEMNNWPNGPAPTLRQWGELDYGGGIHTFFPSIAADAEGNAVITFARSATDEYISMGRAFRRHDDSLNTFRPMEFVKLSFAPHTSGRWGDYSGAEPDPVDPDCFWIGHEWTQTGSWRTWIAKVDTLPLIVTEPSSFNVVFGQLVSGGLADLRESDDARVVIEQRPSFTPLLPAVRLEISGTALGDDPAELTFVLEASAGAIPPEVPQRIELFNYSSGQWEQVDDRIATLTDSVVEVMFDTNTGRFIRNNDLTMQARMNWFSPQNVLFPAWTVRIDQTIWRAMP